MARVRKYQNEGKLPEAAKTTPYNTLDVQGYGKVNVDDDYISQLTRKYQDWRNNEIKAGRNPSKHDNDFASAVEKIKSGQMTGIDVSGRFLGTNLGDLTHDTGLFHRDRGQEMFGNISNWTKNIQDIRNKPVVTSTDETPGFNYSLDQPMEGVKRYGYNTTGFDQAKWDTMTKEQRYPMAKSLINAISQHMSTLPSTYKYNPTKDTGISKEGFDYIRSLGPDGLNKLYDTYAKDGFTPDEENQLAQKGVNLNAIFSSPKNAEQLAADLKTKKEDEVKASEEKLRQQNILQNSITQERTPYEQAGFTFNTPQGVDTSKYDLSGWTELFKNPLNWTSKEPTAAYHQNVWDDDRLKPFEGYWAKGKYIGTAANQEYLNERATIPSTGGYQYPEQVNRLQHLELTNLGADKFGDVSNTFPELKGSQLISYTDKTGDSRNFAMFKNGKYEKVKLAKKIGGLGYEAIGEQGGHYDLGTSANIHAPIQKFIPSLISTPNISSQSNFITPIQYQGITSRKEGGIINFNKIKKLQMGGFTSTSPERVKEIQQKQQYEDTRSAETGELFDKNYKLTTSDKMQIGALAGDIGALTATLLPGVGNVTAAGIGVASTGLNYAANLERHGFKWGDLGAAAGGLALDAATIIPGVGTGAKAVKIMESAKNIAPVAILALNAAGLASSAGSFGKLINEGAHNMTLDDWRSITTGLTSLTSLGKLGARQLATKNVEVSSTNTINLKDKSKIQFADESTSADFIKQKQNLDKAKNELEAITDKTSEAAIAKAAEVTKHMEALNPIIAKGVVVNAKGEELDPTHVLNQELSLKPGSLQYSFKALPKRREGTPITKTTNLTERQFKDDDELDRLGKFSKWWTGGYATNEKIPVKNNSEIPKEVPKEVSKEVPTETTINVRKPLALPAWNQRTAAENINISSEGPAIPMAPKEIRALPEWQRPATPLSEQSFTRPRNQFDSTPVNPTGQTLTLRAEPEKRAALLNKLADQIQYIEPEMSSKVRTLVKSGTVKTRNMLAKDAELKKLINVTHKLSLEKGGVIKAQNGIKLPNLSYNINTLDKYGIPTFDLNSEIDNKVQSSSLFTPTKFNLMPGIKPVSTLSGINPISLTNSVTPINPIKSERTGGAGYTLENLGTDINSILNKGVKKLNLPLAANLIFNKQLYDEALKAPRPPMTPLTYLDRVKSYGQESIQPQLNQLNQYGNQANIAQYSDPKLNVARNLTVNANIDQNKMGLFDKLSEQNRQVDAQNAQISEKERLTNAQIAEQNLGKQDAYNRMIQNAKMQYLTKTGQTITTGLEEAKQKSDERDLQRRGIEYNINYNNMLQNTLQPHREAAALALNKPVDQLTSAEWTDYYTKNATQINQAKNKALQDFQLAQLKNPIYSLGGKMPSSEKVAIEETKGENQQQLEILKDANKRLEIKLKINQKALDNLTKDNSMLLKKILS